MDQNEIKQKVGKSNPLDYFAIFVERKIYAELDELLSIPSFRNQIINELKLDLVEVNKEELLLEKEGQADQIEALFEKRRESEMYFLDHIFSDWALFEICCIKHRLIPQLKYTAALVFDHENPYEYFDRKVVEYLAIYVED